MPITHIEAWDDLMRRAGKTAGVVVRFNHAGIAVLERLPDPAPAAASVPADASSSSAATPAAAS